MEEKAGKIGKPRKYKTAGALRKMCDRYFEECEGEYLVGEDGKVVFYKGQPVYQKQPKAPSLAGLASFCGFSTKQGIINYRSYSKEFNELLDAVNLKLESFNWEQLYHKETFNGARFSLIYNHHVDASESDSNLNVKIEVVDSASANNL